MVPKLRSFLHLAAGSTDAEAAGRAEVLLRSLKNDPQ
jgi:hypothetical protein